MYPPLKKKKIEVKNLDLQLKLSFKQKNQNLLLEQTIYANQIKTLKIKLVLWLAPLLSPKEMWIQTSLWPKW
jgi:hypothetical protein